MRIVFMGTPEFSVPTLERLHATPHEITEVITRPDQPRGRGRHMEPPAVKVAAESLGLRVWQTDDLRSASTHEHIAELCPDLMVVVAFRILPPDILDIPRLGSINLHASLLPKYRGAAPINWALINGEKETGVSVFYLEPRVDTGRIIRQKAVSIRDDETYGELYDRLKHIGAEEVVRAVDDIAKGRAVGVPQDEDNASSARKLTRDDARIDWSQSSERIRNLVRGTTPAPGAWTTLDGVRFGINRVDIADADERNAAVEPGTIVFADSKRGIAVRTGDGAVWLTIVHPPGKKPMLGDAWLRGARVEIGTRFV